MLDGRTAGRPEGVGGERDVTKRINGDILGGLVLIGLGGFVTYYAATSYALGTLRRMGPGMFPTALGVMLILLGLILLIGAWRRGGGTTLPQFNLRPFLAVTAGVFAFGLTVRPFGMVPAIVLLTVIGSLAEARLRPLAVLVLTVVMVLISVLVFRVALDIFLPLFAWPF